MARKQKEDEIVQEPDAPVVPETAVEEKLAQGSIPHLTLTPTLIATIHANRDGRAVNSDLATLWSALYEAAGPMPRPLGHTFGK